MQRLTQMEHNLLSKMEELMRTNNEGPQVRDKCLMGDV